MSKFKRYTVFTKNPNATQVFNTLLEARRVGFERYRQGTFTKLTNINNVVLNLM